MKRYVFALIALAGLGIAASAWSQQPKAPQPGQPGTPRPATQPTPVNQPTQPAKSDAKASTQPAPKGLATPKQRASYGIGLNLGSSLRQDQLTADDLDMQAVMLGFADALADANPAISLQEIKQAMMDYHEALTAKIQERAKTMAEKMKMVGEKNKTDGAAYLAANKTKDGVKTTPSGLQYKVLKSGTGATPKADDIATVHYRGTLTDGTVFDSSYDRGEPATFPVTGVIKGWTEALKMMKVGDKLQLVVPAELAYGGEGRPPKIGPNAVLVFDVELLDVAKDTGGLEPIGK
jgi:FKBP-type peptidyl-prolyl cis-trans isomerase FklB